MSFKQVTKYESTSNYTGDHMAKTYTQAYTPKRNHEAPQNPMQLVHNIHLPAIQFNNFATYTSSIYYPNILTFKHV